MKPLSEELTAVLKDLFEHEKGEIEIGRSNLMFYVKEKLNKLPEPQRQEYKNAIVELCQTPYIAADPKGGPNLPIRLGLTPKAKKYLEGK